MPKRNQPLTPPGRQRTGGRRIRAGLGVRDPRNMTRREKKTVGRFYTEQGTKSKRHEKGDTFYGDYSRRLGVPGKHRSGKIIPLAPELIPQENKVIELPSGKFRYRTLMTLFAPMPNKEPSGPGKYKWTRRVTPGEAAGGFKDAVEIKVVVDFSPEFFPHAKKPFLLKGEIGGDVIRGLRQTYPETADASLTRAGIGPELRRQMGEGVVEGVQLVHIPKPSPREYAGWDKMWLVRTPDGIPIGISLTGGAIQGCHWFRTQLERIMHGLEPEGEPCKIFVTDPSLLRRNPNVKRLPFYRSLPTPRGSPSLS